jgi:hypothetical protein
VKIDRPERPLEEPQAALERAFIDEFLRRHGHSLSALRVLPAEQARSILQGAVSHAATRLAELEARAHYIHEIHGVLGGMKS